MSIFTFPSSNTYFNLGMYALLDTSLNFREKQEKQEKQEKLVIVCMAPWSIRDIVFSKWLQSWSESKILIISDRRFFPLAKYLQIQNSELIEFCHISELFNVLESFFSKGGIDKIKNEEDITHLTYMEFISLQNALNGVSAHQQAKAMGLSCKTIFTHRKSSAKKLKVRKLSHLLSPKILYSKPTNNLDSYNIE